jgi:WD40 repeat protein
MVGLIFTFPFLDVESSNKKIKPLLVINDANVPVLSYDGGRISVGPEVGVNRVYDVASKKMIGEYRVKISDSSALSPDGKLLRLFGPGVYTEFDVDSGKIISEGDTSIYKNGGKIGSVGIANEGGMASRSISKDIDIATNFFYSRKETTEDQPAVIVGRLSNHSLVAELRPNDGFMKGDNWQDDAMTPDTKLVAATRYNNNDRSRRTTVVWDVASGKIVLQLPFYCHWLSLADAGKTLITRESGDDKEIQSWDVSTGKKIATINMIAKGQKIMASGGVVSPDGKILVTTRNADFYLWDTSTGKFITLVQQDHISKGNVKSAAFSGNGKILAIGSDTEVVTVWSMEEILSSTKSKP